MLAQLHLELPWCVFCAGGGGGGNFDGDALKTTSNICFSVWQLCETVTTVAVWYGDKVLREPWFAIFWDVKRLFFLVKLVNWNSCEMVVTALQAQYFFKLPFGDHVIQKSRQLSNVGRQNTVIKFKEKSYFPW